MGTIRFNELQVERAQPYIQEWVEKSAPLGRLILKTTDLSSGYVRTTLAYEVGVEAASTGLEFGGKNFARPRPLVGVLIDENGVRSTTDSPELGVMTFVTDWLTSRKDGVVVLWEGGIDRHQDREHFNRWVSRWSHRVGLYQSVVYIFAGTEDVADMDLIINALGSVTSGHGQMTGFLTTSSDLPFRGVVSELDRDFMKSIALNTEAIFVGGYDGEGHIVWTRTRAQHERWSEVDY